MKIRSIMIRVYDIDRSLEFYQTVLGLKVIRTRDEFKGAKLYYMGASEKDVLLTLCYNFNHPEKYTLGTHWGHIGYEIDSMEEFSKKLDNLGIEFDRQPFKTEGGYLLAFMKDPDGITIELVEDLNK